MNGSLHVCIPQRLSYRLSEQAVAAMLSAARLSTLSSAKLPIAGSTFIWGMLLFLVILLPPGDKYVLDKCLSVVADGWS